MVQKWAESNYCPGPYKLRNILDDTASTIVKYRTSQEIENKGGVVSMKDNEAVVSIKENEAW